MLRLIDSHAVSEGTRQRHPEMADASFHFVVASGEYKDLVKLCKQSERIADERIHSFSITSEGPKCPVGPGWYEKPDGTRFVFDSESGGFRPVM